MRMLSSLKSANNNLRRKEAAAYNAMRKKELFIQNLTIKLINDFNYSHPNKTCPTTSDIVEFVLGRIVEM